MGGRIPGGNSGFTPPRPGKKPRARPKLGALVVAVHKARREVEQAKSDRKADLAAREAKLHQAESALNEAMERRREG